MSDTPIVIVTSSPGFNVVVFAVADALNVFVLSAFTVVANIVIVNIIIPIKNQENKSKIKNSNI